MKVTVPLPEGGDVTRGGGERVTAGFVWGIDTVFERDFLKISSARRRGQDGGVAATRTRV